MKRFFSDFVDLPKHEFARKYLLLPVTLCMFLFALWIGAVIFTPLDKLQRVVSNVVKIDSVITRVKNKPLFKEVSRELRISLTGQQEIFFVSTTSDFGDITSKIREGDRVTIYYNMPS